MGEFLRINLGSGKHYWPGFTNIDYDERADIVGPVTKLDFPDGSVDEIYAIHLFEHLPRLEVNETLAEWRRVLKVGGKLVLELPCLDKIAQMVVDGEDRVGLTLFGIFGDVREKSPYMAHKWCYTKKEVSSVLQESGFSVTVTEPFYHVQQRDMRIIGVKNG
jgi:predicted SAM-dependent methyltransferase